MSDRMRDTRQGHIKEEIEGVCVCVYAVGRHRWRGLSIGVCRKGVVETVGERTKEKNECVRWIIPTGSVCARMHERKLVVVTKVRGLCGCKRLTKMII